MKYIKSPGRSDDVRLWVCFRTFDQLKKAVGDEGMQELVNWQKYKSNGKGEKYRHDLTIRLDKLIREFEPNEITDKEEIFLIYNLSLGVLNVFIHKRPAPKIKPNLFIK